MQLKILRPTNVKMWEVRTDGWWRSQAEDQDLAFVRFTFTVSYTFLILFPNKKSLPAIFVYEEWTVNSPWISHVRMISGYIYWNHTIVLVECQ